MIKFLFLLLLWLVLALISITVGAYHLSISNIFDILLGGGDFSARSVVFEIRLPRILVSSLCGSMLSISGISLQAVFKNPLVGPNIIGVSSAAAFGGALAILLGFSTVFLLISSFTFGILALFLLYYIAKFVKQINIFSLILSGIVINGFFGALISLVQYLADNEDVLPNIVFWLLGSFVNANYSRLIILSIGFLIAGGFLIGIRWRLNLLSLSDEDLTALHIKSKLFRNLVLFFSTILISFQVAISGNIGWIGLVVPHMARFIAGENYKDNLPISAILGAVFMLLIDTASRTISSNEVPLSILTAIIGTPLFIYLLRQQNGKI